MRLCSCLSTPTLIELCELKCEEFENLTIQEAQQHNEFFRRHGATGFLKHHMIFMIEREVMLISTPVSLWHRTEHLFENQVFAKEFSKLVLNGGHLCTPIKRCI